MRLLIADGSAVLRAGLAQVMREGGHEVAALLPDSAALPATAARYHPDAVVAGVCQNGADAAVDAVLAAERARPGLAVLLHCGLPAPAAAVRLFGARRAGTAFLLHDQALDADVLLATLARIVAGGTVADARAFGLVTAAFGAGPAPDVACSDPALCSLSPRERDVLSLMARGRTNSAIAADLYVSLGTVEKRVAAIFAKLDLHGGKGDNRRVLAVLRLLAAAGVPATAPFPMTFAPGPADRQRPVVPALAARRPRGAPARTRVA